MILKKKKRGRTTLLSITCRSPQLRITKQKLSRSTPKSETFTNVNSAVETGNRLGEKRKGFSKPRPLKVVFKEENSKHKMFKNSQTLKAVQELKTITVTPHYTFRQRQMNKTMKQEVSKRRITDPTFTYRKLKQELQNASSSEVQDLTVEEVVVAETEEEAT